MAAQPVTARPTHVVAPLDAVRFLTGPIIDGQRRLYLVNRTRLPSGSTR